jgi:hypothetical protein
VSALRGWQWPDERSVPKASCVQANVVVTVIVARNASAHSGAADCVATGLDLEPIRF